MRTARLTAIIIAAALLCACGGPSVNYKKNVFKMLDDKNYPALEAKIKENKNKAYGKNNALLYYLDLSTPQTDSYNYAASNESLSNAQDIIDYLQTKSVTQAFGTLVINDTTTPYLAPAFEQSLTYFYRGLDYISMTDLGSAAVEARKAVFFLDKYRENKKSGFRDDAFVQYFASMIFEDTGKLSDARIARTNALNAYTQQAGWSLAQAPDFPLPKGFGENDLGEAVILHFNGKIPYKISKTLTFAWNDVWFALTDNKELESVDNNLINAVYAGAFGRSVSVAFARYQDTPYSIVSSEISADEGASSVQTILAADLAANAKKNLEEENAAAYARTITRAVTKYILAAQAKNITKSATNSDGLASLVGSMFSSIGALTEKADTRSWTTIPAQIRMASLFLPAGLHNIKILFKDSNGKTIDEYLFENVQINKGQRTYLYHRTSK